MLCCGANSDVTRRRRYSSKKMKIITPLAVLLFCICTGEAAISIESFEITEPLPYEITTTGDVELSYSIGLKNEDDSDSATVEDIEIYLSDNENLDIKSVAFKSSGVFPIELQASEEDATPRTGYSAEIKADVEKCDLYMYICAKELPGGDVKCEAIGDTNNVDCSNIKIKDNSFIITEPVDYTITTTEGVELTYEITMENSGGDLDIDVTDINLYLADDDDMDIKSAAFKSSGDLPIKVEAGKETRATGLSATVIADSAQCSDYKKLCAQATPNDDTECFEVTLDCSVVSVEENSFVITSPSPSDITYTTYKDTEITFDLQVSATGDEASVTGVNVYFTNDIDSEERVKSEPVVATGGAPTPEEPKPIDHEASDPTTITDCEAKLKLDVENCADYSLLCISLSADGGVEGEECIPIGEEENQAGTTDCSEESGSTKLGIHVMEMFTSLLVVLVVQQM